MQDARPERLSVLFTLTLAQQWQRIQRQLRSCNGLLVKLQRQEELFDKFNNWSEVIAYFRRVSWRSCESDKILKPILVCIQKDDDPSWNTIITALFWHVLTSLFRRNHISNNDESDNLWQNTLWSFFQVISKVDIKTDQTKIAYRIYIATRYKLRQHCAQNHRFNNRMISINSVKLDDEDITHQDESFDKINENIDKELKLKQINRLYSRGLIKEIDKHILIATMIYGESVKEYSENSELDYELVKKRRQRAIKKLQHFEKKMSPKRVQTSLLYNRGDNKDG